ncbi:MAG: hypothetical protein FJ095_00015 [Deltaproteobacteria bacterium]|nr:hypothetical protein [Deltaproteobacteria bacterium]
MSDEPFTHDATAFLPTSTAFGVELSEAEARYAALFAEVIWDGLITPDKRRQLRTAAELLGLDDAATRPVEETLLAAHEARHRVAVVEKGHDEDELRDGSRASRRSRKSLAPLADSWDARESSLELERVVLSSRVDRLEADNARLVGEGERLEQENERLAARVAEFEERLGELECAGDEADAPPADVSEAAEASRAEPAVPDALATPRAEARAVEPRAPGRHRSRRPISEALRAAASDVIVVDVEEEVVEAVSAAPIPPLPPVPKLHEAPRVVVPRNDPAELHRLLKTSPRDPDLLRALYRSLQRADDLDRRYCIAHALVFIGEAHDQERATYLAHFEEAVVRPTRAVFEDEWRELLVHPEQDRTIGDTLAEIAPAVLLGHVTALRASLTPDELDPTTLVDPQRSTEPAVRCLSWAAAILGVKLPPIHLARDLDRGADIVLTPRPATRLGLRALEGRSPRELAFLAGSHLAWYRREHLLARPSGSIRRLEDWVIAALLVVDPQLALTEETRARVEPLGVIIKPLLGEPGRARLRRSLARFVENGGRLNIARWLESVERTVASTGLLLSNDLAAAETVLRAEGSSDVDGMLDELVLFFTSKRCATLRRRLGVAVEG